ncbi:MAG: type II toxin-antitoxin system RelE/ParE family toxin [Anaerolineales bacterium]
MATKPTRKDLVWWRAEKPQTPPFSQEARRLVGYLLGLLQAGENIGLPFSRPMPSIGKQCHELRVYDTGRKVNWRVIYRIDDDAIVIAETFSKKRGRTPNKYIDIAKRRLIDYDAVA